MGDCLPVIQQFVMEQCPESNAMKISFQEIWDLMNHDQP